MSPTLSALRCSGGLDADSQLYTNCFEIAWFLINFCPVKAVSNMYMYEGHDYRDTTIKDQEAFDNMMAGKVVILTSSMV